MKRVMNLLDKYDIEYEKPYDGYGIVIKNLESTWNIIDIDEDDKILVNNPDDDIIEFDNFEKLEELISEIKSLIKIQKHIDELKKRLNILEEVIIEKYKQ